MKTYFVSYIPEAVKMTNDSIYNFTLYNQIQNAVVELEQDDYYNLKPNGSIISNKTGSELIDIIKNKLPEDLYSNIKIISINQLF